MSPLFETYPVWAYRFPRVSGDEPAEAFSLPVSASFSPRERG